MNSSVKDILKIVTVCLIVAISAQITWDINLGSLDIPITLQSLAVMVCCMFLKPQDALIAMLLYLILGAIGLPVFADGASGVEKLMGGSSGFLFGFVVTGQVMAMLGEKGFRQNFLKALMAMFIGTVLLLFCGNVVLVFKYGLEQGLTYGLYPFIAGAVIKGIIGAAIVFGIDKIWK